MSVRADLRIAEDRDEPLFDALGDRVLEPARFVVHFVPRHAEHVLQKHFGQPVAAHDAHRDAQALLGERRLAARLVREVAVGGQLLEHAGDRRRRDAQIGGEAGRA